MQRLEHIRDDREWRPFHTLKDLAAAIGIESAELQEHFLWRSVADEVELLSDQRQAIEDELADVVIHCLNFATIAEIDIVAAIERKIDENELRYPVDEVRGSAE